MGCFESAMYDVKVLLDLEEEISNIMSKFQ